MSEALPMCSQATLTDTPNVISLPVSGDGAMPCALQGGPTTNPFGPAAAPASPSVSPEKDLAKPTPGTSGPNSGGSSGNADLQLRLESRLRARLDGRGSPLYKLTWKRWAIEAQPPICALRASVPRTFGSDSIGLPTVSAREGRDWSRARILASLDMGDGVAKRICNQSPVLRSSEEIVGLHPCFAAWEMGYPVAWEDSRIRSVSKA